MQRFETEIIVRTPQNIHTLTDLKTLIDLCQKYHIATITILCKQDEDDEFDSGTVFYPSQFALVAKGYRHIDIFKELISMAHQKGIRVNGWIPQFHDQVAFYTNSKWPMMAYKDGKVKPYRSDDGAFFVNPMHPGVQAYELSIIKELTQKYDFDAIILDWIRFDDYPMDLSDASRREFEKNYGYDPVKIDFSHQNPKRVQWDQYRSDQLTNYIQKVKETIAKIKPHLKLGIYVLSPEWTELAQDPAKFKKYVDFIAPMCYYDDWGYPVGWIYDTKRKDAILPLLKEKVGNKRIVPVFDTDWDKKIYLEIFSHIDNVQSIGFFHYGKWTETLIAKVAQISNVH